MQITNDFKTLTSCAWLLLQRTADLATSTAALVRAAGYEARVVQTKTM